MLTTDKGLGYFGREGRGRGAGKSIVMVLLETGTELGLSPFLGAAYSFCP